MRCRTARELISLYLAPDESWLDPEERRALQAHFAICEPCRRDCQESREAIALLRKHWQISRDTLSLLNGAPVCKASSRPLAVRYILRVGAVAACLAISVLGWWVMADRGGPVTASHRQVARLEGGAGPIIESMGDGGRIIVPGNVIRTQAGEIRTLLLNKRHQVVVNAETQLTVGPLMEMGRTGYLVSLARGEVCVHVEHDGNPFAVRTAHGTAVITGTTFDMKATEMGTTLAVVEGSVLFESENNAVQVAAGQRSVIAAASGWASLPAGCDATTLIAWATPGQGTTGTAQATSLKSDDFPPFIASADVSADLRDTDYVEWVQENRNWFERQFPAIFWLKEALSHGGIEADYPELLLESGVVWQFAWPPASGSRLLAAADAAVIKIANHYGKNLQWPEAGDLLRSTADTTAKQVSGPGAFALWQQGLDDALDANKAVPVQLLFNSLYACDYLRRTRSLIWLAVDMDRYALPDVPKRQLQDLLHKQVVAADGCTNDCLQLFVVNESDLSCDSSPYRQLVQRLRDAIRKIAEMEEGIANETAPRHP